MKNNKNSSKGKILDTTTLNEFTPYRFSKNPFVDPQITHELIQEKASGIGKKRNKIYNDYLDDWFDELTIWFEAERQIRQDFGNKELQTTMHEIY